MAINLAQLAPFITQPGDPFATQKVMGEYADTLQQNRQLAQQQQQFAARQQLEREQLQQQAAQAAAQLGELHSFHTGSLGIQQQGLDAETQQRQAAAIKAVTDAVSSGNFVQAKALMPYLQALGVNAREMAGAGQALPSAPSTQLSDPNAAPHSLAAFSDMPQLSAPALSAPAPAPAPAGPSGVYGFAAGNKDLGQLDLNQLSAEQRAQAAPLFQAMMQSSRPQEVSIRNPVIDAVAANPMFSANPAAGMLAIEHATDPAATRLQSGINSQAQSALASKRADLSAAGQDRMFAAQAQQQMRTVVADAKVKDTLSSVQGFEKVRATLAKNYNNPTAWAEARTAMARAFGENRLTEGDIARAGGMDTASAQQRIEQFLHQNLEGGVTPEIAQNMMAVIDAAELALNQRAYGQYRALREMQKPYLTGGELEHPMAAAFTDNYIRGEFSQYKWYKDAEAEDRPDLVRVHPGSGGAGRAGAGGSVGFSARGAAVRPSFEPSYAPERIEWTSEPREEP